MDETPTMRQLYICEKLIFEQGSRNVSLINCFEVRITDEFPTDAIPFIVYGQLTDGAGAFTMELRVCRLDTFAVVFQRTMPLLLTDRLHMTQFVYRVNNLRFPVEGGYEVSLYANGVLLGMTVLSIRRR